MGKKGLTAILSTIVISFYIAIIMYVFFDILNIDTLANFSAALIFEIIGFCILAYFILGNILKKPIKTGYFVPLIMITVVYTVALDVINLAYVTTMAHEFFVLINLIVLCIYFVIAIPMYIMGRR